MTILHVTPYFAPAWAFGGVCRVVSSLAEAQRQAGDDPIVLTTDAASPSARLSAPGDDWQGIRVVRVRNWSQRARQDLHVSTPIGFGRALRRLVDAETIDVMHCHEFRTTETVLAAGLAGPRTPARVLSPHGTLTYGTGRRRAKRLWDVVVARRVLPAFDGVVALTADEAREVHAYWRRFEVPLGDGRVHVVANGVDLDACARRPSRSAARARWGLGDGPVVLFLGRLHPRKGVDLLVEAFAAVAETHPAARLLIAGPDEGAQGDVERAVRAHRMADRVVLTGLLEGDDRWTAFAAADLFALPAVGEGFSMAVLEALACGVPVLITEECHFPEVATSGAGLVLDREAPAWTSALVQLLADPSRRAAMRDQAAALAQTSYGWPHIAAEMRAAYARAIDHHAGAGRPTHG